jgi:hypothetical protein
MVGTIEESAGAIRDLIFAEEKDEADFKTRRLGARDGR